MATQAQAQGLDEFANHVFTLEHPDDHVVILRHEGESLVIFSQSGATKESIQAECAEHLAKYHGWYGCLWSGDSGS